MVILGDQSSQGGVGDIIGRVKPSIEKGVSDKKPRVLGKLADIRGNHKDCHQAGRAAEVSVKHPRASLPHPAVGLVNQRAKENIADSVKQL